MTPTAELATKKRSPGFQEKNRGVTPSVAAPGVTHPSDATVRTLSTGIILPSLNSINLSVPDS